MLSVTSDTYRESGLSLMTPPVHENPVDHDRLAARGAKMSVHHGVADAAFSAEDMRQWMLRLDKALGGNTDRFARCFPVPGMAHGSGRPATDPFGPLSPLVQWMELGEAPRATPARARGPAFLVASTPTCRPTGRPTPAARCAPTRRSPPARAPAHLKTPAASPAAEARRSGSSRASVRRPRELPARPTRATPVAAAAAGGASPSQHDRTRPGTRRRQLGR